MQQTIRFNALNHYLRFTTVMLLLVLLVDGLALGLGHLPVNADPVPCYDFKGDTRVGIDDIQTVAGLWGQPANAPYDTNDDCFIDARDVQAVAAQWRQSCLPGSLQRRNMAPLSIEGCPIQ